MKWKLKIWLYKKLGKWLGICYACGGHGAYGLASQGGPQACFRCDGTGRYEYHFKKEKA